MQGINPFTPGIQRGITSRREETTLFESYLNSTRARNPISILLIGAKGMGKSYLLGQFLSLAEKNKALCAIIRAQKSDTKDTIVKKIVLELIKPIHEAVILGAFSKKALRVAEEIVAKINGQNAASLLEELHKEIEKNYEAVVIFIEEVEKISLETVTILTDLTSATCKKNIPYMFVFSRNGKIKINTENIKIMVIPPLTGREIEKMIFSALKPHNLKMGEECLRRVIDESEGHPLILLTICWTLYDKIKENERVISKGHYAAYSPAIMSNLARELFDDLYEETSNSEQEILTVLASGEAQVSEIAKKINKPLNTVTTLIARLTKRGTVEKKSRGRYRIFNALFGTYVKEKE